MLALLFSVLNHLFKYYYLTFSKVFDIKISNCMLKLKQEGCIKVKWRLQIEDAHSSCQHSSIISVSQAVLIDDMTEARHVLPFPVNHHCSIYTAGVSSGPAPPLLPHPNPEKVCKNALLFTFIMLHHKIVCAVAFLTTVIMLKSSQWPASTKSRNEQCQFCYSSVHSCQLLSNTALSTYIS